MSRQAGGRKRAARASVSRGPRAVRPMPRPAPRWSAAPSRSRSCSRPRHSRGQSRSRPTPDESVSTHVVALHAPSELERQHHPRESPDPHPGRLAERVDIPASAPPEQRDQASPVFARQPKVGHIARLRPRSDARELLSSGLGKECAAAAELDDCLRRDGLALAHGFSVDLAHAVERGVHALRHRSTSRRVDDAPAGPVARHRGLGGIRRMPCARLARPSLTLANARWVHAAEEPVVHCGGSSDSRAARHRIQAPYSVAHGTRYDAVSRQKSRHCAPCSQCSARASQNSLHADSGWPN